MKAVFLSDAHLKSASEPGYRALMRFLDRLRGPAAWDAPPSPPGMPAPLPVTDLFLAGDIFDFWFSRNGRIYSEFEAIVGLLRALAGQGAKVHLSEGNHDFFLKGYFGDFLGMQVYEDWATIEADGQKILVAHGDLVDGENTRYLKLRRFLRTPLVFNLQRILPLGFLWGIARLSSSMSKELMGGADERILSVMQTFALERFEDGYDAVVLGHCHRPHLAEYFQDGKKKTFVTLGDWLRHYSYLYYEDGRFSLETEP